MIQYCEYCAPQICFNILTDDIIQKSEKYPRPKTAKRKPSQKFPLLLLLKEFRSIFYFFI